MSETSGAVADHAEAERERAEAERIAAEEALAAEQADLDAEPSQQEPTDESAHVDPPEPGETGDDSGNEPEDESQGPSVEASGQLSLNVGGKRPTGASLRLTGGKVDIVTGELRKGQKVTVMIQASVDAVEFVDIKDPKTGTTVGCDRRHKARITSVELLEQE
jgi:hypothetical protein